MDPGEFAVRYLGHIEVGVTSKGARVRLRPSIQARPALVQVLYVLAELRPRRIVLAHFDRAWHDEMMSGFQELVARIEDLIYGERSRHPDKRFHAEQRDLRSEREAIHLPFVILLEIWSKRGGILPADITAPFRLAHCKGRTTLVDVTHEQRLLVSHRGRQLTHYGRAGWTGLLGQPVEAQPDPVYAQAASRGYIEVRDTGEPRIETCEAGISRADGQGRRSVYDRLLLPWRTGTGRIVVSGVSVLRGRTDWSAPTNAARSATSSADDIQTQDTSYARS